MQLLDDRYVGELDIIKQTFPLETNKCCTKMFQLWLNRSTSANWEDFIVALQICELHTVADKVSKFYGMSVHTYICTYIAIHSQKIHIFSKIRSSYLHNYI